MQGLEKIKVLFIAGFGPIVRDVDAGRRLYAKALEIPFKEEKRWLSPYRCSSRRKGVRPLAALASCRVLFWKQHLAR